MTLHGELSSASFDVDPVKSPVNEVRTLTDEIHDKSFDWIAPNTAFELRKELTQDGT